MQAEVLLFDIGGTVFDWQTAIVDALNAIDPDNNLELEPVTFAQTWRRQSLVKMEAMANESTPTRPFDQILQTTLDTTLLALDRTSMSQNDRVALIAAWETMPAWPGAAEALQRLRQRYFIAPHTILSMRVVASSSKAAGIDWDAIISCDALQAVKPNPESYRRALQTIGRAPEQVCYVASHPSDLRAAGKMAMKTAYLSAQLHDYGERYDEGSYAEEFDLVAGDFADLASQLDAT